MKMDKMFKFAGVSRKDGVMKARFANDLMRVKVLAKTGSSDIDMIELKEAMTKADAVAFLLKIDFDNGNKEVRAALEAEVEKRTAQPKAGNRDAPKKEAKKPKKTPPAKAAITLDTIKAKKAPVSTKSKAQIEAELAALDDAPF
jgi:hypothetical protein